MSDGVRGGSNDGSLPLIASDDIGGQQYQRMKLSLGVDGSAADARDTNDVSTGREDGITAVGVGPGFSRIPADSATLDSLNETYTVDTAGAATVTFGLLSASSPTGITIRFEGTVDGTNWAILYFPWDPTDTWIIEEDWGPSNPGEYRIVDCVPFRQVRAKLVAYVSGSVTLAATISAHVAARPVLASLFDKDQGNFATISNASLQVTGDVDSDSPDSGRPVKIGGSASLAAPTPVADGDRVNAWLSRHGSQNVILRDAAGVAVTSGNPLAIDIASTSAGAIPAAGLVAHDDVDAGFPLKIGGKSKAAAPADVSGDGDAVNAWFLRNGAQATVLTAAGALIGGDAANGIDVDVTRVGGTVAVTQSGTWDEVGINDSGNSITVDAPVGTPAFVRLSDGAAPIATLPVSLAAVPSHAVTNAGVFATQVDGAALTALQLIDDPVVVLGTDTYTEATSKGSVIGAVRRDADTSLVNTTNEFGPLQMDANGRLKVEAFSGETLPVSLTSTTVTGTVAVTQSGTWDEIGINDSGNSITVDGTVTASNAAGDIAHDSPDSGNPVKLGARAIAHGTNPTAVAAADRTDLLANRAGIPFSIGGHPNVVTLKHTTITTAVTDAAIVTVAGGLKIVVTSIAATLDNASTVFPTLLLGFGTANTPTTTGVILAHGGVPAGGGIARGDGSGILGIGADGEDLRVTTTGNATGNGLQIVVTYYTIES